MWKKSIKYLVILLLLQNCAKQSFVERVHEVKDDFEDLEEIISVDDNESSSSLFIDGLLRSKIGKISNEYKKKVISDKFIKKKQLKKGSGIDSLRDTIPGRLIHSLDSNKCSSLKERKILIRESIIKCLKVRDKRPFMYRFYAMKKLRVIDVVCFAKSQKLEKRLKLDKARGCYYDLYKSGVFISPLNLIK